MTEISPSISRAEEKKYGSLIIGCDEAGRGPYCGPITCAAAFLTDDVEIDGINDSKQTSAEERDKIYEQLVNHPGVFYGVCNIAAHDVDYMDPLQASMFGMRESTIQILRQLDRPKKVKGKPKAKAKAKAKKEERDTTPIAYNNDFVAMIDGPHLPTEMPCVSHAIKKGDSKIYSIAAASIIAKVTRDRIMEALHEQYPDYGLSTHKGYGTREHEKLLFEKGPCEIYRYKYRPVRNAAEQHNMPIIFPLKDENKESLGYTPKDSTAYQIISDGRDVIPTRVLCGETKGGGDQEQTEMVSVEDNFTILEKESKKKSHVPKGFGKKTKKAEASSAVKVCKITVTPNRKTTAATRKVSMGTRRSPRRL